MISQQAKLSNGLSSKEWGNYKRTQQGALTVLLLYIYYYTMVRATTMCLPHVHPPCFYLMFITHPHVFSIRPPCFLHMPWCHTFNLCCTCTHHVYTIVVATTRRNSTRSLLTLAKLSNGLFSSGDLQENSTRSPHCIAPLYI